MNPLIANTISDMTPFLAILVGIAIGCQILAIYCVFSIMAKKYTQSIPYLLIALSLIITTLTRIDNFLHVWSIETRTVLLTIASVFISIGFVKLARIHSLIKKNL